MRKCLSCRATFPSTDNICPTCGAHPVIQDGFPAYAPALAQEGAGFKSAYFDELARLEAGYFWFRARNRLIIWALGKYCPEFQSFLEIGCGTGYVLSGIVQAFPQVRAQGAELFSAGLAFAAARQPSVNFMQMDARHIPFVDEFDAIGAFDVLEHIEKDDEVLKQIFAALKPGGILLLTVPQHEWLWSSVDDYACHVRRYTSKVLHTKLNAEGFEILRSTSFVSSLLPALWVSRFAQKDKQKEIDAVAEFRISPWINNFLETIMKGEIAMIRNGLNFPLGGSRLVVARKS